MKKTALLGTLALATLTAPAGAVITYVDADLSNDPSSNTAVSGGGPLAAGNLGGWVIRGAGGGIPDGGVDTANFANNGNVLQGGNAQGAEQQLTTTIVGLDPLVSYEIYVFFWDDQGNPPTIDGMASQWDIDAGLASGVLSSYSANNATVVDASNIGNISGLNILGQSGDDFSDFVDGNRTLHYASLGTVPAGSASIDVFVLNSNLVTGQRTWYDGVGFQAVPEPSGTTLVALSCLVAILLRRR